MNSLKSTFAASAVAAALLVAPPQDAPAPKDPAPTTPWHAEPVLEKCVVKNVAVYNHADATIETATVAALAQQQYEFLEKYSGGAPRWVLVHVGNKYECGFSNPTGETVGFGDSTDKEMCVMGVYRYPATGVVSLCIDM